MTQFRGIRGKRGPLCVFHSERRGGNEKPCNPPPTSLYTLHTHTHSQTAVPTWLLDRAYKCGGLVLRSMANDLRGCCKRMKRKEKKRRAGRWKEKGWWGRHKDERQQGHPSVCKYSLVCVCVCSFELCVLVSVICYRLLVEVLLYLIG